MKQKGLDWFQEQRLVVLLFGHRNTSALYFEQGQFKQGDSPLYGFSQMIDLLVARYSVLDRQALLMALVKSMEKAKADLESNNRMLEPHWGRGNVLRYPGWRSARAIDDFVSVRDETLREAEIDALSTAVEAAFDEYWEKLEAWIRRVVPDDPDEVIVSGGAALMLEPKLVEYFSNKGRSWRDDKLIWDADLKEMMKEAFSGNCSSDAYHVARFADAYGLFDQMLSSLGAKS